MGCSLEHAITVQPERLPSRVSMSILDQADNLRRIAIPNDDSAVNSSAYPCSTLLGGMRREILRDRLSFPLHGLRVSRYRGERASPLHHGERNYTSTTSKLSKTSAVLAPQPRCFHLSRERIAGLRDISKSSASPESRRLRQRSISVPPVVDAYGAQRRAGGQTFAPSSAPYVP